MKKTVLTFGLIAGAIISLMLVVALPFNDAFGFDKGAVLGYTSMVAAFLLIFFGVRSYRDNVGGGSVSFGRALAVGSLIVAVASVCYVITWEAIYYTKGSDFNAKYQAHVIEKARASGKSQEAIDKQIAQTQRFMELYKNPLFNSAVTFLEPLPVGLIVALIAAGVLRRPRGGTSGVGAPAAS